MTPIRRAITILALIAILIAAGVTIARFNSEPARSDEQPTLATSSTGAASATPTSRHDDGRSGGDENVHIDKPGESK